MSSLFRRFTKVLGPGFVTGASDDDPSGIATYAQAGASLGYAGLWMLVVTLPLMIAVQEMCARIGIVTGKGLIKNMLRKFPRWSVGLFVLLLVFANSINIGADLGMMAASMQLLTPNIDFVALLLGMAAISLLLQIVLPYHQYARYLKWMSLSLLAYILVGFAVHADWVQAIRGSVIPRLSLTEDSVLLFLAVFGTTLSPYLCFWQTNEEIEENGLRKSRKAVRDIRWMRYDVGLGMAFSNVIAWFIVLTGAAVLFVHGWHVIDSPMQAALLLEPIAGRQAFLLFTIGIVGTGLLAIPVLAGSAAYACSEFFHAPEGLSKSWKQARVFYGVIAASVLIGVVGNFLGINQVRALIYAAVCNGLAAPGVFAAVLLLGNDREIMREHRNGTVTQILGWCTVAILLFVPLVWIWLRVKGMR